MTLKERIDMLNRKCGIKTYTDLLLRIFRKLDYEDPYEEVEKQKSNFTQMLYEKRPLKKEYYIPMEQIYNVSMDYILNGKGEPHIIFKNSGLRYTASTNNYAEFERLGTELTPDGSTVIFNSDEYNKTIFDYIVEYEAIEGIRYLTDKYDIKYRVLQNCITSEKPLCFCVGDDLNRVFEMIVEKDEANTFVSVFDAYDLLTTYYDDKVIYKNKEYLEKLLKTNNIFEALLTDNEYALNVINYGLQRPDEEKSLFMNPLINSLFTVALEKPDQYKEKLDRILTFALDKNNEIVNYILSHYDNGSYDYSIDDKGYVKLGSTKYGLLFNPGDIINPSVDPELKSKIAKIKQINDKLIYHDVKDFFGNNHKKIKYNEVGHVLKLASNNEIEYSLHKKYEEYLPIPKFYGTKDGIDEFENYRGKPLGYGGEVDINYVVQIAGFLRLLHDITMSKDGDTVYTHNSLGRDDFYFTNGVLTDVVNWDKAEIGDMYSDMIFLLLNFSGMNERYRDNQKVIENIKKIFDGYGASEMYRMACIGKLKIKLNEWINDFPINDKNIDENYIFLYESYLWCRSFVDLYYNKIQK